MKNYDFTNVGLDRLIQAYYENYRNDSRLPDLFEMIEEDKLRGYLIGEFQQDFKYRELVKIFGKEE